LACFCSIDSFFIFVVDCLSLLSIAATAVDTYSIRRQYSQSVPLPLILFLFVLVCLVVSILCFDLLFIVFSLWILSRHGRQLPPTPQIV
jgi:hypothetical protein